MILPNCTEEATEQDIVLYIAALMQQLKIMSKRFQLIGCELCQVDRDNKIFDLREGVVDKAMLYTFRKQLKDGTYEKLRDGCRIKSEDLRPEQRSIK